MTLLERLRALVETVPAGGSVTIPRDWLAGELQGAALQTAAKSAPAEHWLTAAQVAERLGTSRRWVYDHATALGGKQLSPRCLRFPDSALSSYVRRRNGR